MICCARKRTENTWEKVEWTFSEGGGEWEQEVLTKWPFLASLNSSKGVRVGMTAQEDKHRRERQQERGRWHGEEGSGTKEGVMRYKRGAGEVWRRAQGGNMGSTYNRKRNGVLI